jgi:hypothetical protein
MKSQESLRINMKARLIKLHGGVNQSISTPNVSSQSKKRVTKTREAIFTWVQDYQEKKPVNPRQQFAELFKVAA